MRADQMVNPRQNHCLILTSGPNQMSDLLCFLSRCTVSMIRIAVPPAPGSILKGIKGVVLVCGKDFWPVRQCRLRL